MKQWQRIIAVCAASIGLGLLSATPALAADAAKDLVLRGDAKCTRCHDEADSPQLLQIATTRHGVRGDARTPGCTSCHGESEKHMGHKGSGKPPSPDRTFGKKTANTSQELSGACMTCHKGDEKRTYWEGTKHAANDVSCNSCHTVHSKTDKVRNKKTVTEVCFTCHKEQRAELNKISVHPIKEGKIGCGDCHNPHGSAGPSSLAKNTIVETCYQCHAEKRGPFLWEHLPVTENCANCHTPHGSNILSLLRARPPFMCTECHDGPHSKGAVGPGAAGYQAGFVGAPSGSTAGKGCINCHVMVHGSNSPAGAWLHR